MKNNSSTPTNVSNQNSGHTSFGGSLPTSTLSGLKPEGLDAKTLPSGIRFGKPSQSATTSSSSSGSELGSFLEKNAVNSITSILGGGGALGALGGIGGLVSAMTSLFGGAKKTLPPLVDFTLPNPQAETFYVGAGTGSGVQRGVPSNQSSAIYVNGPQSSSHARSDMSPSGDVGIAQAVKTALLTSSSLNDVISEL